ncbi:hypothetical protein CERSUDRAFT_115219 [Gelatoporia subvermispora B]|uniref:Uncharacterized protein n=1 Tax=Ceriporiopsis subvermispora (strain B) TaxID=914234 RepID=M2QGT9_CERS8|nr:hypothetical protein CERSUDRAFT_115219 [Gelatoporia subvermispora B]
MACKCCDEPPRLDMASPRREIYQPAPITRCTNDISGWGPCNQMFVNAHLGNYGYIDCRAPARFVRIGNVFEKMKADGDSASPSIRMRWKASCRPSDWPNALSGRYSLRTSLARSSHQGFHPGIASGPTGLPKVSSLLT